MSRHSSQVVPRCPETSRLLPGFPDRRRARGIPPSRMLGQGLSVRARPVRLGLHGDAGQFPGAARVVLGLARTARHPVRARSVRVERPPRCPVHSRGRRFAPRDDLGRIGPQHQVRGVYVWTSGRPWRTKATWRALRGDVRAWRCRARRAGAARGGDPQPAASIIGCRCTRAGVARQGGVLGRPPAWLGSGVRRVRNLRSDWPCSSRSRSFSCRTRWASALTQRSRTAGCSARTSSSSPPSTWSSSTRCASAANRTRKGEPPDLLADRCDQRPRHRGGWIRYRRSASLVAE